MVSVVSAEIDRSTYERLCTGSNLTQQVGIVPVVIGFRGVSDWWPIRTGTSLAVLRGILSARKGRLCSRRRFFQIDYRSLIVPCEALET